MRAETIKPVSISLVTVCGLADLDYHRARGVTHVLSILDPELPDPEAFAAYQMCHRTVLRFHDAVEPGPNIVLPEISHVEAVLDFGRRLARTAVGGAEAHLLVHCHMGVSRSTAAMATLLAQAAPEQSEDQVLDHLLRIRPQAWPNSRMIAFADQLLERKGRLISALAGLYGRQLARQPQLAEAMRRGGRGQEIDMARRLWRAKPAAGRGFR